MKNNSTSQKNVDEVLMKCAKLFPSSKPRASSKISQARYIPTKQPSKNNYQIFSWINFIFWLITFNLILFIYLLLFQPTMLETLFQKFFFKENISPLTISQDWLHNILESEKNKNSITLDNQYLYVTIGERTYIISKEAMSIENIQEKNISNK